MRAVIEKFTLETQLKQNLFKILFTLTSAGTTTKQ